MARQQVQGVGQQAIQGAAQISNVQGGTYNDDPAILQFAQQILGTGRAAAGAMQAVREEEVTKVQQAMRSFAANNPEKMDQLLAAKTPEERQSLMSGWRSGGLILPMDDPAAVRQLDAEIGVRLQASVRDRLLTARTNGEHLDRVDPENPDAIIKGKSISQIVGEAQQDLAEAYGALGEDGKLFYGESLEKTVDRYSETFYQEALESGITIQTEALSDALMADPGKAPELLQGMRKAYPSRWQEMGINATIAAAQGLEATEGAEAAHDFLTDLLDVQVNKDLLSRDSAWASAFAPHLSRLDSKIDQEQETTFREIKQNANMTATSLLENFETGVGEEALRAAISTLAQTPEGAAAIAKAGGANNLLAAAVQISADRERVSRELSTARAKAESSKLLGHYQTRLHMENDPEPLVKWQAMVRSNNGLVPGLTPEDSATLSKDVAAKLEKLNSLSDGARIGLNFVSDSRQSVLQDRTLSPSEKAVLLKLLDDTETEVASIPHDLPSSEQNALVQKHKKAYTEELYKSLTGVRFRERAATLAYQNKNNQSAENTELTKEQLLEAKEAAVEQNRRNSDAINKAIDESSAVMGKAMLAIQDEMSVFSIDTDNKSFLGSLIGPALSGLVGDKILAEHPAEVLNTASQEDLRQWVSDALKGVSLSDLPELKDLTDAEIEKFIDSSPTPPVSLEAVEGRPENAAVKEAMGSIWDSSAFDTGTLESVFGSPRLELAERHRREVGQEAIVTLVLGVGVSTLPSGYASYGPEIPTTVSRLVAPKAGSKEAKEISKGLRSFGLSASDLESILTTGTITVAYGRVTEKPGLDSYSRRGKDGQYVTIPVDAEGMTLDIVPFIPERALPLKRGLLFGYEQIDPNAMTTAYKEELNQFLDKHPELLGRADRDTVVSRQLRWFLARMKNMNFE
jgi:hypothetical protein